MGTKKLFTPEEVEILKENSYTWKVSADRITYTQEFQKAFWELSLQGLSGTDAFKALGYDPKILGKERIHNTTKRIRKQGNSPEGIRQKPRKWMRTTRKQFKLADLEQMSHKEAARRMQKEIVYLQQQVEFFKKGYAAGRLLQTGEVVMASPNSKFEIIRVTLQEKDNVLTVQELCEIAGVSRSGYYNWLKTEPERQSRDERDKADFELILEAYRYRG